MILNSASKQLDFHSTAKQLAVPGRSFLVKIPWDRIRALLHKDQVHSTNPWLETLL